MPGKRDYLVGAGFNVLKDVLFKDIVGHAKRVFIRIEALFLQVVTVVTTEVADGANGFSEYLIGAGGLCHNAIPKL
jgi:hypothetical protein